MVQNEVVLTGTGTRNSLCSPVSLLQIFFRRTEAYAVTILYSSFDLIPIWCPSHGPLNGANPGVLNMQRKEILDNV